MECGLNRRCIRQDVDATSTTTGGGLVHARHSSDAVAVATRRRWDHNITTFAIAEGPRDALLSRNLANYESSL